MALTKVGSGGIENGTNAANATFFTIDASEQITVASEGGAVTTSLQQGLTKAFINNDGDTTIADSLNISSMTDDADGAQTYLWTSNFAVANSYVGYGLSRSADGAGVRAAFMNLRPNNTEFMTTAQARVDMQYDNTNRRECNRCTAGFVGDLA